MQETLRELAREVARDPARTALTLFGVVLGAAAIVFLASVLASASTALSRMNQRANGADVSRVEARAAPRAKTARPLSERDAQRIAQAEGLPGDMSAASNRLMSIEASIHGRRFRVGVQSGGAEFARLAGMALQHGRWQLPAEDGERLCVIGDAVWREMSGGVWPMPQDTLLLHGNLPLTVVGVLQPRPPMGGGGGDGTWMWDHKVYVSNTVFKRSIEPGLDAGEIVFKHPTFDMDKALPDLRAIAMRLTPALRRWHLGANNFEFDALSQKRQSEELILLGLGAILFACGVVAMVVGGVNVMNAQLVQVGERTREYGIRRALGAPAASLQRAIVVQTVVLTGLGALAGVALGLGAAFALSRLLGAALGEWAFQVIPASLALALGSSLLVGLVAGLGPARRASRMVVSECLRARA